MKGHVPTPRPLASYMVEKLFAGREPNEDDRILYPGIGSGPFAKAVYRYCEANGYSQPRGIGIESNPDLVEQAREELTGVPVEILEEDFLTGEEELGCFNYIIGNPPYVPIDGLSEAEKKSYRERFYTASGRFDLYILFFEQALKHLDDGGRLVFVTPEKYEYVETARPLRRLLAEFYVREIDHIAEDTFGGLVTYPAVTVVERGPAGIVRIRSREGVEYDVDLPADGKSWASSIRAPEGLAFDSGYVLDDVCVRVSCGVATGADRVFVKKASEVPANLEAWTYPTISGKQLTQRRASKNGVETEDVFISPYHEDGSLASEDMLGSLGKWLSERRERLEERSCVEKDRRPWYGWHENPPMKDILRPKILCKDVASKPRFWYDKGGQIVPRHSVYYLVPSENVEVEGLLKYLNSEQAEAWLRAHCHRAANGYLRLQSTVLKKLPIPEDVVRVSELELFE